MVDALWAELFKTTHRRMTYILLVALLALVGLFYIVLWLRIRQGPDPGPNAYLRWLALREGMSFRNVVPYGLQLERFFATLVCVTFAATMMGNEYDWRTAGVIVSRGVKRHHFLAAKVIVSVLFVLVSVTAGFLLSMALSAWFSALYSLPYGTFGAPRFLDAVLSVGRTSFVVLPFVFMAILFATIWRSAGQAVGFSLGFFFLEGVFTSLLDSAHGLLAHIPEGMLNINAIAVMATNGVLQGSGQDRGGPFSGSSSGVGGWQGAGVLAIWTAVFLGFSFWRFQRRDIQE